MKIIQTIAIVAALSLGGNFACAQSMIGKNKIQLHSDLMTPEALWAMGRISTARVSPNGKQVVYQVGYYSIEKNKGQQTLHTINIDGTSNCQITTGANSESDAVWIENGEKIAFLSNGQVWKMNPDGTERKQLSHSPVDIEGFIFSPDGKKIILIKSIPYHDIIKKNPTDLPKATGRLITDLNYRHWDHYVESIAHPFIAEVYNDSIGIGTDIMKDEPYECPSAPFGGIEQLAWSPDSKQIAYSSRKRIGLQYAISTDADIYLYDIEKHSTNNLCKPNNYKEPFIDPTKSMKEQTINHQNNDYNVGYDTNPCFSPDGKYIAWLSMARNGYESDRNRLLVYNLATKEKRYISEKLETNVDAFCWNIDNKSIYFTAVWHGCSNIYKTNLQGNVTLVADGQYDYSSLQIIGNSKKMLVTRHSMSHPDDIFVLNPQKKDAISQITDENKHIFDQLSIGNIEPRWIKTTDDKDMLVWIVFPPHFDAKKKYPTLLFCEGGPQSPVSQFWSYRWNMQIMAANGYVVIAPNRRGLPGFGSEWNEEISGDWTGQCMNDYLCAIDDAANNLPYVDKNRLGAVGASFGGFSVYYLAGHHDNRFKCFIAHDGAFNLESMYTDTEEAWFSNWEYDDAYWNKDQTENAKRTYANSPHKAVDKWDTPILCIHGEKDYRINANQGFGAFNAARMKGIPAELLIFPDENHWVLKPQNGILWQRTFFSWLDRWLK